jgi:hypothetical protein
MSLPPSNDSLSNDPHPWEHARDCKGLGIAEVSWRDGRQNLLPLCMQPVHVILRFKHPLTFGRIEKVRTSDVAFVSILRAPVIHFGRKIVSLPESFGSLRILNQSSRRPESCDNQARQQRCSKTVPHDSPQTFHGNDFKRDLSICTSRASIRRWRSAAFLVTAATDNWQLTTYS